MQEGRDVAANTGHHQIFETWKVRRDGRRGVACVLRVLCECGVCGVECGVCLCVFASLEVEESTFLLRGARTTGEYFNDTNERNFAEAIDMLLKEIEE